MLELPENSYAISFKEEGSDSIRNIYKHIHLQHIDRLMPKLAHLDNIAFEVRPSIRQLVKNPKTIIYLATSWPDYLANLRTIFEQIEDSSDSGKAGAAREQNLSRMFDIVKRLINEPDEDLIVAMIDDQILPLTLGAL